MLDINKLLNNVVTSNIQGYALYLNDHGNIKKVFNGKLRIDSDDLINEHTNFRLASVTKQFIAYAVMNLVKEGKVQLDGKLSDYICCLPSYCNNITIDEMLCHTSGLEDYESMHHTTEQIHDRDVEAFLQNTKDTYFKPGTDFQYSNTAFVMLGILIEKVSGIKLGDYLDQVIFKPLGMDNTILNYEGTTKVLNRAYGHKEKLDHSLIIKDQYWCSATLGDGGIYSNIVDLIKWMEHLKTLEYPFNIMKEIHSQVVNTLNYGYGLFIKDLPNHHIIYHTGSTIGFGNAVAWIDNDSYLIFLSNLDDTDGDKLIANLVGELQ